MEYVRYGKSVPRLSSPVGLESVSFFVAAGRGTLIGMRTDDN